MSIAFVTSAGLSAWISGHTDGNLFLACPAARGLRYQHLSSDSPPTADELHSAFSAARSSDSPKDFILASRRLVARYGGQGQQGGPQDSSPGPMTVLGLRACELRAGTYYDRVFLEGEFKDPFYEQARKNQVRISCDCLDIHEFCFCNLLGATPYAGEGDPFDLNLSPVDGGYLVETGSPRGEELLATWSQRSEPTQAQLTQRDEQRQRTVQRLTEKNAGFATVSDQSPPNLLDEDQAAWQRFSADCVECGACTNVCPTCYCFYLYDQAGGDTGVFDRYQVWDSCMLASYHRMAGLPNAKPTPRPRLRTRLANRVRHKFVYAPQQVGMLGCVGCGRCIEGCLGTIDLRAMVRDLAVGERVATT